MKAGDIMPRGGKRDGAGRKKIGESDTVTITTRIPEEVREEIEELGKGDKISEKFRYVIDKGLEKIKEDNQGE